MSRFSFCSVLVVVSVTALALSLNSCGANTSDPYLIQHIVVIVQENRTPDNLFQDPALIARGADIATSGVNSKGQTIRLKPIDLASGYDLDHSHAAFVAMYNGGKMDGADRVHAGCTVNPRHCIPHDPQFRYVNPPDVQPYFQLAEQYTFGDRMFQTNQGPSFPAHQFIFSGTSAPTAASNLFAAENPGRVWNAFSSSGCTAPAAETVALIDPKGKESQKVYPCFDHPTLTDLLEAATISWRYYSPSAGIIWNAPNAIQHVCEPDLPPPNGTRCIGLAWQNNVLLRSAQVLSDIQNHELAAVSWVIPTGQSSDHPGINNGTGPSWIASIVNTIGNSPYWFNTAIIITWDDWGGWYDHVAPPQVKVNCSQWGCGYLYGFRVPLIVVSPYAKANYISHVTHDFGSILKFIEHNFGLQSLGYADALANDLSDCFNFSQTPLKFQPISTAVSPEEFLNDQTPPTDPDDD